LIALTIKIYKEETRLEMKVQRATATYRQSSMNTHALKH